MESVPALGDPSIASRRAGASRRMESPWLAIPLAEYEEHMCHPGIYQAGFLATVLSDQLAVFGPESLAVVGCAGGNGFDRIDPRVTKRVVGIDINPDYLRTARNRYAGRFECLDLYAADIEGTTTSFGSVEFVYAALIFEYVDISQALSNLNSLCDPGGHLVTVLQLPSASAEPVSPSPFASLRALSPIMRLIEPAALASVAVEAGFAPVSSSRSRVPSGKEFAIDVFCKAATGDHIERPQEKA